MTDTYTHSNLLFAGPGGTLRFRLPRRSAYQEAFDRAMASVRRCARQVRGEVSGAVHLVRELEASEAATRQSLALDDPRYHRLEVCDRLIEQSLQLVEEQPEEAKGLAELALSIAGQLDEAAYPAGLLRDLEARCWASLANSHRALGESPRALEAFRRAGEQLATGSGDPLEDGHLCELGALLLEGLGKLTAAQRLIERQLERYRELRQPDAVRRVVAHQAALEARLGNWRRAAELCRAALGEVEGGPSDTLTFELYRQLVAVLDVQNEDNEIRRVLSHDDLATSGAWSSWGELEGLRISARSLSKSRPRQAERRLALVSARFLARRHVAEALRCHLDRAAIGLACANNTFLLSLRSDLSELLASGEVEREVAAVVGGLSQSLASSALGEEKLRCLRQELALAQSRPERLFACGQNSQP